MQSMTGFGRSSTRLAGNARSKQASAELDISVKSVNGRYMEVRFHLPREYAPLEGEFKAVLADLFSRGTFDVYLNRVRGRHPSAVRVNKTLARSWMEGYRELGRLFKFDLEPSLDLLTRIPEIFDVEERTELSEAECKLAKRLLHDAAMACRTEREREGKALEAELMSLCGRLEAIAEEAERLKEAAQSELESRLSSRLRDLMSKLGISGKVDDQRIAQEVVIALDRADISEEISRLREHLKAYRQLLKKREPQGKKLDFYAQELLREVNTIGSKSHIADLTGLVVEAKTLVEKIREQVQNVE